MAKENVIKMQIQFRRDTEANWKLYEDVVPAAGEPCFIIDKNILKIGDGKTMFKDLEPIDGAKLSADDKSIILTDGVFKLIGFDTAEIGTQPIKSANGEIEWVVPFNKEIDDVKSDITTIQSNVEGLKLDVVALQSDNTTLLGKIEGLDTKIDTVDGAIDERIGAKINEFANQISNDGTVNTLKELIDYVATHGGEFGTVVKDITTLQDKLDAIEENAQINVIEKISVGSSILDVINKTVEIPVASLGRVGVVKSSTGANKVNISENGEMSVNKVSVHSVFVPIGDELILDGGSAYKGAPAYSVRIGNMGCNSISDAVAAADNGDVIALQEDINMGTGDNDHLVSKAENVTIDLGGKTLTANGSIGAVKVEGGITTLDGDGTVQSTLGSDKYSMAVWVDNGTVVINNGTYKNETDGSVRGTDLIYASGTGCIEINGGTFEAAKPEWTLNCKDVDYKAGTAKIVVKGGSFKGFDPANNNSEGAGTNFVAEGYKSVLEGEYYVVKPI